MRIENVAYNPLSVEDLPNAQVVVNCGEEEIDLKIYQLCASRGIPFQSSCENKNRGYRGALLTEKSLEATCEFVKVNGHLIGIVYPVGNYIDHNSLEETLQTMNSEKFKDRMDDLQRAIRIKNENELPLSGASAQQIYEQAEFFIKVEGPFKLESTKLVLSEKAQSENIVFEAIPSAYPLKYFSADSDSNRCCSHQQIIRIMGITIALINNSGSFSSKTEMAEQVPHWFPRAQKYFATSEEFLKEYFQLSLQELARIKVPVERIFEYERELTLARNAAVAAV